ncbi:MAG: phthalate 4,5-dioxygenase [Rhizobacter sp.]|nr:phthalate 4,5-dioxygenase [Rhizobacter sp.]
MLTEEQNNLLVRVGPGTPMGTLLRRYWMPIAGVSEFETRATKPIRLMGEDLVLYRDLSGNFGLIDRHCPHRRADLAHGIVEKDGLRCNYHGWCFDAKGSCVAQPYEDTAFPDRNVKARTTTTAYPVQAKAGLLWTYMGPQPAPCLPDWELFSRPNGFAQIVLAEVPCNWFQCQENSIDPVHFEWMHENWGNRLRHGTGAVYGPTHTKLDFEEFEFGFVYKRVRENTDETHPFWTIGRTALWPNCFFLGEHFEWRVPIDDENTLSVTWKFTHVPKDREPYVQTSVPAWTGPVRDEHGQWITSHVMNQDFLAWAGQGRIADRTREKLGASDRGIVMMRRRFFDELDKVGRGEDPKGLIRDPARNVRVPLPTANRDTTLDGFTTAEIMADPRKRIRLTSYMFQAGQPDHVKREFGAAMGIDEVCEFEGLTTSKAY